MLILCWFSGNWTHPMVGPVNRLVGWRWHHRLRTGVCQVRNFGVDVSCGSRRFVGDLGRRVGSPIRVFAPSLPWCVQGRLGADPRTRPSIRLRKNPRTGVSQPSDLTEAILEFTMPTSAQRSTRFVDDNSCPIPGEPTQDRRLAMRYDGLSSLSTDHIHVQHRRRP